MASVIKLTILSAVFSANAWAGSYNSKFYAPRGVKRGAPLVVAFSGCTQDIEDLKEMTRLNDLAKKEKFYVLYLSSNSLRNCWPFEMKSNQSPDSIDLENIIVEIGLLKEKYSISEVFGVGMSAGAAMLANLAACFPGRFDAVAFHSGVTYGYSQSLWTVEPLIARGPRGLKPNKACDPLEFMGAAIVITGDAETRVHPENSDYLVRDFVSGKATRKIRIRTRGKYDRTEQDFVDHSSGQLTGKHVVIHGMGHAWSGSDDDQVWSAPKGPDATALIWDFFKKAKQPLCETALISKK